MSRAGDVLEAIFETISAPLRAVVDPITRPIAHWHARRKIEQLVELRDQCASVPQAAAVLDKAIAAWTARYTETGPR
jgi:hypothetical protein